MARRGKRRSGGGLRGMIRAAYRILGAVNTVSHILSGDPGRLLRHTARKRTVKFGGRLIK